jgi:cytochrome c554/c'-like protein
MRTAVMFSMTLVAGMLALGPSPAQGAEASFVGSKKCKMCHLKEWQSWSETKMAKAYDLLAPNAAAEAKKKAGLDPAKDYTKDATCLSCHTTGYGKPGGFVSIDASPDLVGVGCEMCHGAGGTYTQSDYMSLKNKEYKKAAVVAAGLTGTISKEHCANCHNDKSPFVGPGYVFDFEARKAKGTHEKFPLKYQH